MLLGVLSNIAFTFFALFYSPIFLQKIKQADDPKRLLKERWGDYPKGRFPSKTDKPRIWIHAVSVGEVRTLAPLLEKLKTLPVEVFVSTVTPTGQGEAKKLVGDAAFYIPFDLTGPVKKALARVQPDLVVLMETELWPNFILEASKLNIPIGVINGRLSLKSFGRYQLIKGALKQLLEKISFFAMQTDQDADRVLRLGAPASKVFVMGNMKFDVKPGMLDRNPSEIKTSFNIPLNQKVWVTGSTHPGEERRLMAVFTRLRSIYSNLSLIIAPRHIERAGSILSLAKEFNFKAACLSTSENADGGINVWVVDEIGVLNHLYSFADIVFMGGSLVEHGGQNPIEPALFKKSVLVGPFTSNFTQVYSELEAANAVRRVVSEDELFVNAKELMGQDELRESMGLRAYEKVLSLGGTTEKTAVMIQKFLPKGNLRPSSLKTTESSKGRETCPTS